MQPGMIMFMVVRTLGFVIVRGLLGLVGLGLAPDAKDVEIAVLREGCKFTVAAVTWDDADLG